MSNDKAWDDPPLEKGIVAVNKGRPQAGLELLAEARDHYELRALRVSALAEAAVGHVDALTALAADDPDALLLLGATRIKCAWEIRGASYARYVGEDRFQRFWAELDLAREPLERAAAMLPADPVPWDQLQWYGIGSQVGRSELDRIWAELVRRDPALYCGYYSRVQAISDKWYGSNAEAAAFAEDVVRRAAPGDPIVAIAAAAHFEVVWRRMDESQVPAQDLVRQHFSEPHVADLMVRAAKLWARGSQPHPRSPEAHHLFGAAFYFGGRIDAARYHLAQVDRRMPRILPWAVPSILQGRYYAKVRRELRV